VDYNGLTWTVFLKCPERTVVVMCHNVNKVNEVVMTCLSCHRVLHPLTNQFPYQQLDMSCRQVGQTELKVKGCDNT